MFQDSTPEFLNTLTGSKEKFGPKAWIHRQKMISLMFIEHRIFENELHWVSKKKAKYKKSKRNDLTWMFK